jgi:hypothetical protein
MSSKGPDQQRHLETTRSKSIDGGLAYLIDTLDKKLQARFVAPSAVPLLCRSVHGTWNVPTP